MCNVAIHSICRTALAGGMSIVLRLALVRVFQRGCVGCRDGAIVRRVSGTREGVQQARFGLGRL